MSDLLSAFNGAIPVGALRARVLHNRINKLVVNKEKKPAPIVQGGDSIVVENLNPPPEEKVVEKLEQPKEKLDETAPEMVKISTTQEKKNEKKQEKPVRKKRKYTRRKKSTK